MNNEYSYDDHIEKVTNENAEAYLNEKETLEKQIEDKDFRIEEQEIEIEELKKELTLLKKDYEKQSKTLKVFSEDSYKIELELNKELNELKYSYQVINEGFEALKKINAMLRMEKK